MSAMAAAPALASGDVSAERHWNRQQQQASDKSMRPSNVAASPRDARKADVPGCCLARGEGHHEAH
jgi:hypothetical protein